ncbi:hypothetical protein F4777DRAFT_239023 [Nemania sp. FL0916]|nr:hypothetical protein F4777DRAFT_239023 [Nemania sp. FL0916]
MAPSHKRNAPFMRWGPYDRSARGGPNNSRQPNPRAGGRNDPNELADLERMVQQGPQQREYDGQRQQQIDRRQRRRNARRKHRQNQQRQQEEQRQQEQQRRDYEQLRREYYLNFHSQRQQEHQRQQMSSAGMQFSPQHQSNMPNASNNAGMVFPPPLQQIHPVLASLPRDLSLPDTSMCSCSHPGGECRHMATRHIRDKLSACERLRHDVADLLLFFCTQNEIAHYSIQLWTQRYIQMHPDTPLRDVLERWRYP